MSRFKKLYYTSSLKSVFFISAGVIMASIGLKGFLLPNGFLDGGAMGIALLGSEISNIELSILIVLVNIPFIIIGVRQVSSIFAIRSTLAILSLAILVHYIELPLATSDPLLIAVFGGFFLGAGIGLTIRGGAVIDGTEVLAILVNRKSSLSVGDFIAIFNVVVFALAAFLTSLEIAMYSMLTYLAASKTVDFILNGVEEYIGVMIVSEFPDKIKASIINDLGRGVTVFRADPGFGKTGHSEGDKKVLFCAITRLEVNRLVNHVELLDDKAFIIQYALKDAKGGMIKRRAFHE
jgi:uncharacterized membrane-anchored protein YitT (DUF2179 family)